MYKIDYNIIYTFGNYVNISKCFANTGKAIYIITQIHWDTAINNKVMLGCSKVQCSTAKLCIHSESLLSNL